jgi:hypothetical protein
MYDEEVPEIPNTMTVSFIQEYLEFIRSIASDDERAHVMEDNIHFAVIESISLGKCQDIVNCCKEVMKSTDIPFHRWCA